MPAPVLLVGGSPSSGSRSSALLTVVADWLRGDAVECAVLHLRDLPAEPLLRADAAHPALAATLAAADAASALVIATPIYKAAYSGLLKLWLDLLPQHALRAKHVLPLATGGSLAHVLALDYALRPVLTSLGAPHVHAGVYVLESDLTLPPHAPTPTLAPEPETRLRTAVATLARTLACS
jgi:FMN reductase